MQSANRVQSWLAIGTLGLLTACSDMADPTEADSASPLGVSAAAAAADRTYEITVENLTGGQPLTPPLLATHRRPIGMFDVGAPASFGVKEIAENGNLTPLMNWLQSNKHVSNVVVAVAGSPPPVMPGGSVTVSIDGGPGSKYVSFVSMLICTNDGFTGLNGQRLPQDVGDEIMLYAGGYDAGTELNTEDFNDIVPPCPPLTGVTSTKPGSGTSDPALAEGGVIRTHSGVIGNVDLEESIHDWTDPVARITIRRTG